MNASAQLNLGTVLMNQAGRCLHLTAAVPEEYEAGLWAQIDSLVDQAALFGDEDALGEKSRRPGSIQMTWGFA